MKYSSVYAEDRRDFDTIMINVVINFRYLNVIHSLKMWEHFR